MANKNPSPETRFKPGQSGNPGGRPRKADDAYDSTFDELQGDPECNLTAFARKYPKEFYAMYARKLTTSSDSRSHVLTESVTEEQARREAEAFLESQRLAASSIPQAPPGELHDGDAPGLSTGSPAPQDSGSA